MLIHIVSDKYGLGSAKCHKENLCMWSNGWWDKTNLVNYVVEYYAITVIFFDMFNLKIKIWNYRFINICSAAILCRYFRDGSIIIIIIIDWRIQLLLLQFFFFDSIYESYVRIISNNARRTYVLICFPHNFNLSIIKSISWRIYIPDVSESTYVHTYIRTYILYLNWVWVAFNSDWHVTVYILRLPYVRIYVCLI